MDDRITPEQSTAAAPSVGSVGGHASGVSASGTRVMIIEQSADDDAADAIIASAPDAEHSEHGVSRLQTAPVPASVLITELDESAPLKAEGTAAQADTEQFTFEQLPADAYTDSRVQLSFLQAVSGELSTAVDLRDCFTRWGMHANLLVCHLSFDRAYQTATSTVTSAEAQSAAFLRDLFNAPALRDMLRLPLRSTGARARGKAAASGVSSSGAPEGVVTFVSATRVPATAISMSYFDRVHEAGIVTADATTGAPTHIKRRMEDMVDGVAVGDDLRAMCVCDDDAHAGLYSDAERAELLFRLFGMLVCGGPMSQYDDTWTGYVAATKALYRDCVRVVRAGDAPDAPIVVASHVYAVDSVRCGDGGGTRVSLFPYEDTRSQAHMDVRDACYVCIHAHARQVTVLYRPWVPYW